VQKPVVILSLMVVLALPGAAVAEDPPPQVEYVQVSELVNGCDVYCWVRHSNQHRRNEEAKARTIVKLKARWRPTVDYGLRLAAAVFGVSYWELRAVSRCESMWNPFAANGIYLGVFQLHWRPYGFSPFDPIASSLSTAATVKREGWRQWQCKP
jgi:hypothetical protein